MRAGSLPSTVALGFLCACAGPLTRPPGPSCAAYMTAWSPQLPAGVTALAPPPAFATRPGPPPPSEPTTNPSAIEAVVGTKLRALHPPPSQAALPPPASFAPSSPPPAPAAAGPPVRINVLILSGGGSFGAYGAGFLGGLYGGAVPAGEVALGDYDLITGVSTGAIMTPYVWGAVVEAKRPDPAAGPNRGLADLARLYKVSDADLFRHQSLLTVVLGSTAVDDPRGRLESKVRAAVAAYAPLLRSEPVPRADVGAVDLVDGRFYSFDLKGLVDAAADAGLPCFTEAELASAAIPLAFPPRFIDGQPFYDGGLRFGSYFATAVPRAQAQAARSGARLELNIRVIVNGNLSANDPDHDAARALACDQARLAGALAACPPVANSLLGSVLGGAGGKGLVPRAVEDVLVDQIQADSLYRIYETWRAAAGLGSFAYTYVSNAEMAAPPSGARTGGACQAASGDQFDRRFMDCLYALGRFKGAAAQWTFVQTK